ncbi:ribonuclease H-like domain-containing protein [Tanacetum coccineum]
MWKIRIEQFFQIQDYALWEVIENRNSFKPTISVTTNKDGSSTSTTTTVPVTTEEKIQKKNDVKARSMLLMALPNEHLLTFSQYKDAKTLFEAIKARFGGNEATKKTQKTLLKKMYENFSAPSTESLDSIFNRLQKINVAFVSTPSSTNDVNTASVQVSTVSTSISTVSTNSASLSDATVYAFLANQPNGSQLVHEDLEQIHDDDLEEIDLKWNLALLSMRARKFYQRTRRKITIDRSDIAGGSRNQDYRSRNQDNRNKSQDSSKKTMNVEDTSPTAMIAIDGAGFDWSFMNYDALKNQYDSLRIEFNKSEFDLANYKRGLASVEEQLVFYKKNKKEKESIKIKVDGFKNASKSLDALMRSQVAINNKKGIGFDSYNVVAPPLTGLFAPLTIDLSNSGLKEFKQPEFPGYGVKVNENVYEKSSNESNHLIKDCDFHDKRMAQKPVLNNMNNVNKEINKGTSQREGDPHVALKDTGIFDSGCYRHMTGNKSYLTDYQDHDGGFVAFAGSSKGGKITRKGRIKTTHLDFEDVYFVKELKFNLFSVSQMCDRKNSVLFTETECLILSPDFKLPDENQVMLKIPRKDNMYNFDLKNIVPSKGLTCLIVKATNDESNMWHRRLGHINFKTMNKLVKGNLVRGLPSKTFENDHTCVACQKGKQHKASCKTKLVLVTKPHNKTPYELLIGRPPIRSFMRPFGCPVTILNTLDHLGKFDGKADEGFLVGYSINSKAFRVYNSRTKKVEENLHVNFLENKPRNRNNGNAGLETTFDARQDGNEKVPDQEYVLLPLMHTSSYVPLSSKEDESSPTNDAGKKNAVENPAKESEMNNSGEAIHADSTNRLNTVSSPLNTVSSSFFTEDHARPKEQKSDYERWLEQDKEINVDHIDPLIPDLEDTLNPQVAGIFGNAYDDEDVGAEADMNNLETTIDVSPIPTTRIDKDHPKNQILGEIDSAVQTRRMHKQNEAGLITFINKQRITNHKDYQNCLFACFLSQIEPKKTLVDLPYGKKAIGTKWVFRNKKDQRGIVIRNKARLVAQGHIQEEGIDYDEVFAPVARIEAIRLFLAYASYMDFTVYQMDVKSAFLYGTIEEKVYVRQPLGFEDPAFPDKVYKVEKALYGLHQAPRAWYETLYTYLLENGFRRSKMTFYLWLQVEQRADGIFLSQDKYVYDILQKFGYSIIKSASTPMETHKPLTKDENGIDVDVHLYRSMIRSLMYLTSSRLDDS